jgi:ComF family protein
MGNQGAVVIYPKNMSLRTEIQSYLQGFTNLVFPSYCAACGHALYRNEHMLCLSCFAGLPRTCFHRDEDNEVAQMFWGRVPVCHATSFMYFAKGSRYQQILHELKYNGQKQIGTGLGRMFGNELKDTVFSTADLIHPVPLHPSRLKKRGYNQSELIASGMAEILDLPIETDLISRVEDTLSQTRKSRYERWENVENIFHCEKPDALVHKHILLVDDVITTGATLEACANSLGRVEGITISIATLAFAKLG